MSFMSTVSIIFPGLACRASGIPTKGSNLTLTKQWAAEMRTHIIQYNSLPPHYWAAICVPKTSRKNQEALRIVAAPEMPFYINQTCLFWPFVQKARNCRATNDFKPFFTGFDTMIRKLAIQGNIIETVDMKDMGGRVPKLGFEMFNQWYGSKMRSADRQVLAILLDDIRRAKMVLPTWAGSYVVQTEQGWMDGPFGTTFIDAWFCCFYYLYCLWKNIIADVDRMTSSIGNPLQLHNRIVMEVHGDNIAFSIPKAFVRWLSWTNMHATLASLGQNIKDGGLIQSSDPCAHEIMGFHVKLVEGRRRQYYVGYRPAEKTVRTLVYREHRYRDPNKEASYILAICQCLNITDCWHDLGWKIVQEVTLLQNTKTPLIRTEFQRTAHELERFRAGQDPRTYYWLTTKEEAIPFDWDDVGSDV